MIVVDVETGGLDSKNCALLSIGAIDFNHPNQHFYGECQPLTGKLVNDQALEINGFTREYLSKCQVSLEQLMLQFKTWCVHHDSDLTIAGENPAFDRDFLDQAFKDCNIKSPFGHRTVDMHSVAYSHMMSRGKEIPKDGNKNKLNADVIHVYTGIPAEPRPHNALNGAIWETESLYRLIHAKRCFNQFEQFPVSIACLE